MVMNSGQFEYDFAVSFAGEDRATAERFAELLRAEGYSVFYDFWNKADLWGRNLYQHLAEVYSKKARFCVMFLSRHYAAKAWTKHEMQAAQERAFREHEAYILPVRLDDTAIPGIGDTVGYMDLRRDSVEEVAKVAIEKITAANARGTVGKGGGGAAGTAAARPAAATGRSSNLQIRKEFTEHERDTYLEDAYETIAKFFEASLAELQAQNANVVGRYRRVNANHFTATVYKHGKVASACGIRLGGLGGVFTHQIVYSNDPGSTNSMNEGVSAANDGQTMFLKATGMSAMMGGRGKEQERLTPHEAAELFWALLIAPLQR